MIYSSDQVKVLYPHINSIRLWDLKFPRWFVLGGPADGDEAQRLKARYPHTACLAVEPSFAMVKYQRANGFPGTIVEAGLYSRVGKGEIVIVSGSERNSSMVWDIKGKETAIDLTTIDALDEETGPFEKGILWLDIEGMELEALRGAVGCLARGAFQLVNVEVNDDYQHVTDGTHSLLSDHGFKLVKTWDNQGRYHNRIYKLTGRSK